MKSFVSNLARFLGALLVIVIVIYVFKIIVVEILKTQIEQSGTYAVTQVFDGDTIEVDIDGTKERVRFIGVDTPETGGNNTNVECYGKEATDFTKEYLEDERVILESDPLSSNRDRYDRLLRYVIRDSDKSNTNYELLARGYSAEYSVFPFTRSDEFRQASNQAKDQKLGLWSACSS